MRGLTGAVFEPIFIYRKEVRVARADRAGAGFVDNSIALVLGGKAPCGLVRGVLGCVRGVAPPPPAPRSVATDFLRRRKRPLVV
nr:MAG TPA: hypothetical protein [Caudoviricetes sp.]